MDVVGTDYGVVAISARSLAWLDSLDKDWRRICSNKRRRGKHASWVREQVRRYEDAVAVYAAIAWAANEDLREF